MDALSYTPPSWTSSSIPDHTIPKKKLLLSQTPTPIQKWKLPDIPSDVNVWIKRDDLTGLQLSGNKIRKLEFILAEALERGHDSVVTLGGIQSNHCRATAVAAKMLGLEAHLILRTSRALVDQDPGLEGNLMVERMIGAHIHLVTKEEYSRLGQAHLGQELVDDLRRQGLNPYLIPVGGSSALGTWGYMSMVEEIRQQIHEQGLQITDIASACGSGGTTAGLGLGIRLANLPMRVHGYLVCDDEQYFAKYIDNLFREMEVDPALLGQGAEDFIRFVQAKGHGYAISKREELETSIQVAQHTGIVLDPVYTGKAVHGMISDIRENPEKWKGRNILFIHTGGLLGVYGESSRLQPLLEAQHRVHRLST